MKSLREIMLSIRATGLDNTVRIVRYSRFRDRHDRLARARLGPALESSSPPDKRSMLPPGRLREVRLAPNGAELTFENSALAIELLADNLARLTWSPGVTTPPYALAKTNWLPLDVQISETASGWCFKTSSLELRAGRNGDLHFLTASGELLREEQPPLHQGERWLHTACLTPDERLFGLGEQATQRVNLRGGSYPMWNSDPGGSYGVGRHPVYMPLPVLFSNRRAGSSLVFFENPFPAVFYLDAGDPPSGVAQAAFEAGQLRYYLVTGSLPEICARFSELTGRAPLPPLWSLGYHQSRWGYRSAEDVRAVAAGFREANMPLDAIHLDIDYMDGYRVFTLDPQRFPDMPGLAAEMGEQGIHLAPIIDPGVKRDANYSLYQQGLKERHFCELDGKTLTGVVWPQWSVFPDFTNPAARRWWAAQYRRLVEWGMAGVWHDMNEPTSFTGWGEMTLPLATRHHLDGQGGDHRQAHNLYALLMNRAGQEGLRQADPGRRPWVISRAGWVGQQRYAWNWMGDTESSWDALRMTIPYVLNFGLSGLPYTGPDIGGFSGSPSAELYLRSFQLSTFLPFFRTHSSLGTARREPWVFGEPYTSLLRACLELRRSLLPYIYTLAWQAAQDGAPLVRPLAWLDEHSPDLWDSADAFLLGDALLVAPILAENASERELLLPPGEWVDFWNDERLPGGAKIHCSAGLDSIPLFVRAGTVLPRQGTAGLELHFYPPGPDSGVVDSYLYRDAGDGYGPCRIDCWTSACTGSGVRLDHSFSGDYQPQGALAIPWIEHQGV